MIIPPEMLGVLPYLGKPKSIPEDQANGSFVLELGFWGIVLLVAVVLLPFIRSDRWKRVKERWRALSQPHWRAVLLVFLLALGLRAALLPVLPIPDPSIHDEFSYLLGAQTLLAGRLTNPTPPLWEHFESFHINMRPTYQSMYSPGQALFLAAGQILFGHPWFGAWLSMGLACAAICWMLQAWVPPQWALLGALFYVLRFATFSSSVNSYMAAPLPALGGALVFGALPRLRRRRGLVPSLLLGCGLALLAYTRPYEGLVVSLPAACLLAWWVIRRRVSMKVIAPALGLAVLALAALAYYNWRGTGNPLDMPYQNNWRQYHITRMFLWQPKNPVPNYRHAGMRRMYCYWELPPYFRARLPGGLKEVLLEKLDTYYTGWCWPWLLLAVPAAWLMMRSPRLRPIPIALLLLLAALLIIGWRPQPYYATPGAPLVVAVGVYGLRVLRIWRFRGRAAGWAAALSIILVLGSWMAIRLGQCVLNPYDQGDHGPYGIRVNRSRLVAELNRLPERHVVIVNVPAWHDHGVDWVYNGPDMSQSKILWARDMGWERNQELARYYAGRRIWILYPDAAQVRLYPYPRGDRTGFVQPPL
jgi:hypothetical protein